MKRTALLIVMVVFCLTAKAQVSTIITQAKQTRISNYFKQDVDSIGLDEFRILIHMDYGSTNIKNPHMIGAVFSGKIKRINLYYSDYPKGRTFSYLNRKRLQELIDKDIPILDSDIEWQFVKQTDCNSILEARDLFHGFEFILEAPKTLDLAAIEMDTLFEDYVVEKVLARNDWYEMLIVTDITGSMSPYIAQLFLWLKLNTIDDRIKQFVFFNDGNTQLDDMKKIGETGGIYQTKSKNYRDVEQIAIQCMLSGGGGDWEENDMEALLKGLELCPDCKENILIVDNNSPVRDIELLQEVEQPIRVIVCGSEGFVNPTYLDIARKSGGSIHLMEEDLFDLVRINEGEEIEISGATYKIVDNKFVLIKKT